mgnify:CR=1 FL=1
MFPLAALHTENMKLRRISCQRIDRHRLLPTAGGQQQCEGEQDGYAFHRRARQWL